MIFPGCPVSGSTSFEKRHGISKEEKVICLVAGRVFKDMQAVDKNFRLPEIPGIDQAALNKILRQL